MMWYKMNRKKKIPIEMQICNNAGQCVVLYAKLQWKLCVKNKFKK